MRGDFGFWLVEAVEVAAAGVDAALPKRLDDLALFRGRGGQVVFGRLVGVVFC